MLVDGVAFQWCDNCGRNDSTAFGFVKEEERFFPIASYGHALNIQPSDKDRRLDVYAWVKASKAKKAIIDLNYTNAQGEGNHQWIIYIGERQDRGDLPADHDWQRYEGSVVLPARASNFNLSLQMYGPGKVWFDDFDLKVFDTLAPPAIQQTSSRNVPTKEELLLRIEQNIHQNHIGDVFQASSRLAEMKDYSVVPELIGLIESDNDYITVYGIGYFGLGKITGVRYSPLHDGPWWRSWWDQHRNKYGKEIAQLPIPEFKKTDHGRTYVPYPPMVQHPEGKMTYIQETVAKEGITERVMAVARQFPEDHPNYYPAIPFLIGLIEADNEYKTIYGIGYFALRPYTKVDYSEDHDAAWWRNWWRENKDKFGEEAANYPIPKF